MKQRKVLGAFTILIALPGMVAFAVFLFFGREMASTDMLEFLFRGLAGLIGGILLWRGTKAGYYFSAIAWSHLIIVHVVSFFVLLNLDADGFALTFTNGPDYHLYTKPLLMDILRSLVGLAVVFVLARDLFSSHNQRNKTTTGNIEETA